MTGDYGSATLYRRDGTGPWLRIALLEEDGTHRFRYEDTAVIAGHTYGYRLGLRVPQGEVFQGEATLTIPESAQLSIDAVTWHGRTLAVTLSLPRAASASLALYDVNGRRWASQRLESLGAGSHTVSIAASHALPPGVFFLRLTQREADRTRRFVVMP
jgi:hypothetical protein